MSFLGVYPSAVREQIYVIQSAWLGCFWWKFTIFKMHFIWTQFFLLSLKELQITSGTFPKMTTWPQKSPKFKIFWNFGFSKVFENVCCFSQIICFPKNSKLNDSLIDLKVHGFRDLENLIHPSWRSWLSYLIGDRVFVKSRQNGKKCNLSTLRGLSGKLLTHTPTSLVTTLLYTLK